MFKVLVMDSNSSFLHLKFYLLLIYCWILQARSSIIYPSEDLAAGSKPLYFAFLAERSEVVPPVQLALDIINNSSLLEGHTLHYKLHETECNRSAATGGLLAAVMTSEEQDKSLVSVLSGECSSSTFSIAEISRHFSLTTISCASNADELGSLAVSSSYYYQLVPSEVSAAYAMSAIFRKYRWHRGAVILQNEPRFLAIFYKLKSLLAEVNITTIHFHTTANLQIVPDSHHLFDNESRISVLLMNSRSEAQILCKAYMEKRFYPKYIYLTLNDRSISSTAGHRNSTNICSPQQRARVLRNSIAIANFKFRDRSNATNVVDEHTDFDWERSLDEFRCNSGNEQYSSFCFDAVWALALAINRSLTDNPGNFNSSTRHLLNLGSIQFNGLSGHVRFDEKGIRNYDKIKILQYRINATSELLEAREIANVDNCEATPSSSVDDCDFHYVNEENDNTVWMDGVPYDGKPREDLIILHPTVSIIIGSLSLAGIIFTFICLIVNYVCRKRKIIRLTSPSINYVICAGCILVYFSNAILSVQPTINSLATSVLCILNVSAHSIGYTLAFVTILAKLGRIYFIFRSTKKKIAIKDKHLFIFIAMASSVPVVIFTAFSIYTGLNNGFYAQKEPNIERLYRTDGIFEVETRLYFYNCVFYTDRIIAVAISYGYIFILKLVALWLAFQIRRVKITGLNDSRYIAAIVYINSILVAINIVVYFSLAKYINVYALFFGSSTWIYTTIIVGLVFIPKMISLCKNPTGEGIFGGHQETTQAVNALAVPNSKEVEEMRTRINTLEKTIRILKKEEEDEGDK